MMTRRNVQRLIIAGAILGSRTPGLVLADEHQLREFDLSPFQGLIGALDVVFCALDLRTGKRNVVAPTLQDRRFAPWSTFKIPNLVIALETGIARDLDHERRWDQSRRPAAKHWPVVWKRDQTLRTAFVRSVPWYFQDVALDVGIQRYRSDLLRFGYGNADHTLTGDRFWLDNTLKISVREQVAFLRRVLTSDLGVSSRTLGMLKEISLIRTRARHALHGKTGAGTRKADRSGAPFEGWFVGWIEKDQRPNVVFALHIEGPSYDAIRTVRITLTEKLLIAAGYLPKSWA